MNRKTGTRTPRPTNRRALATVSAALAFVLVAGCSAGRGAYNRGLQAEVARDYDEALVAYEEALAQNPGDNEYRLKVEQARFNAAFQHFEEGRRAMERGEFDLARAEFLRARELDPTHDMARSELLRVEELLLTGAPQEPETRSDFEVRREQARIDPSPDLVLSPTVTGPIDLRMTQDAQAIFETIGALTGLNIVFDANFAANPPNLDVTIDNMTVYEALDLVALLSNAFWVAVGQNTVMVAPNNTQARASYEPQILKTIYLENSINPADITEIMAALRQLLQVNTIAQSTSMNAIIIRDTADKVAIAEKIIEDFDRAKPEVLVEARVLEVDRNRLRELGILPGQGTSLGVDPNVIATAPEVNLRDLDNLNSGSFNLLIPDTVARFLENDSRTRLVQNPSVRASDGVLASIRIGSRVPVASGSFQPAFVGATGTPVVQFQYIDVGVNMDITPRVLRNREISMQVFVQVAGTAGTSDLGGLILPIFSNREIRHEIRLKEGETNVLGGLISNSETTAVSGLPGLSKIPVLGRLFSNETARGDETEIIILLTPHIVKMPEITDRNLRGILVGTQNDTRLRGVPLPPEEGPTARLELPAPGSAGPSAAAATLELAGEGSVVESELVYLEPGIESVVRVRMNAENVAGADLEIEFDPASVRLRDVADGGLLSRDGTAVTLVQSIDLERGLATVSLDRPLDAPAISGEGAVIELKLEGLARGNSRLRVSNPNIRAGGAGRAETQTARVVTNQ